MLLLQLLISGVGKPDYIGARLSRRAHNPQSGFCACKKGQPYVQINPPLFLEIHFISFNNLDVFFSSNSFSFPYLENGFVKCL